LTASTFDAPAKFESFPLRKDYEPRRSSAR
jgi:hypothetical protein